MLAEERYNEILRLVNEKKTVTVQELTEVLDTSESTIRRDLTTLHKKGSLIKVHGGATALSVEGMTRDASLTVRRDMNIEEKVAIAKYAAALIEKDDFVYRCRVFLPGGELKEVTEAIVGAQAIDSLKRYNFTKGFFGANGVHRERGLTTPDITEALVKEKAMEQCANRYVLADSTKINQISSVTFAGFEEGMILTTRLRDASYKACKNILEVG